VCLTTEDAVTFVYDSCRSIKNIIRNGLVPLSYHNAEYVCVTCTCQCHTGGLVVALWANRNESVSDRLKRYSHCAHAAQYRQSPPSPTHPPTPYREASVPTFGPPFWLRETSVSKTSCCQRILQCVRQYSSLFDELYARYTPPTRCNRNCRVASRRWCVLGFSACFVVFLRRIIVPRKSRESTSLTVLLPSRLSGRVGQKSFCTLHTVFTFLVYMLNVRAI